MGLVQSVVEPLTARADKVVARDSDLQLTGGQLLGAMRAIAGRLAGGAGKVGFLMPNCAAYPALIYGTLWTGRTAVPLNPMLRPNELEFILADAGIDTVVYADVTKPLADALPVTRLPVGELLAPGAAGPQQPAAAGDSDPAVMLYTSGTSGRPKGVPLTHGNLLSNARGLIDRAGINGDDVFLGVLPIFHAFGLTATLNLPLLLGAEVTYLPRFTPDRAAAVIGERRVSVFVAVPGMFGLLARSKAPDDAFASLRFPICGGEALPANIRAGFAKRFGRELLEGYGLTETSPVVAVNLPAENKPGTVGRLLPGVQARILHPEDGRSLPAGEEGEIQLRGPGVFAGYHHRPDENAVAFTADGWFRTGDLGRLDSDGYLSISGRIKELIIRGGEKVMPREIEDVLVQHPGVLEAAVIGEPDGDRGEAVVAFVTPNPAAPPAPDELREFCRGRLADFKVPRRVVVAADLPRGPTGKLLKRALKDLKPA
jgi:long-chain acyl-CoA synthetase